VTWVYRDGRRRPDGLVAALRELNLPQGPGYVWAGAEHATVAALRRHLDADVGIPLHRRSLASYWRAR
jgi:NADPH-dependent ferric siderophore reductase